MSRVGTYTEEQYIETIGLIEETTSPVGTAAIAESMGLSMPSVSEMLHRLSDRGFVAYTPYSGAALSELGRQVYSSVIRRHRLWEVFLTDHLGISWHEVYEHACELEHATSDLVTCKLGAYLGEPEACPHGSPIPSNAGIWPAARGAPLEEQEIGYAYAIERILQENDSACLGFLYDRGIKPGSVVRLVDVANYDGTIAIEVNGAMGAIGPGVASRLRVTPIQAERHGSQASG